MNTNAMNNENTTTTKFRKEGEGYDLSMLPAGYTPVYYGFNCRPRQVRYYKVEESCKDILEGRASRSTTEKFLAKVRDNLAKAEALSLDLQAKSVAAEEVRINGKDSLTRQLARKERDRIDGRRSENDHKIYAFKDIIGKIEKYLAE